MSSQHQVWSGNYPQWVKSKRPPAYARLLAEMKHTNGLVAREEVSELLNKSGLQREHLENIWFVINTRSKYLSEEEFCISLALVATYQAGTPVFDLQSLFRMGNPLIPIFIPPVTKSVSSLDKFGQSSEFLSTDPDDEFSDFQSGLKGVESLNKHSQIHMNPVYTNTKGKSSISRREQEQDVGSRLAYYNLGSVGLETHVAGDKLLIGDVDKYSALRTFVNGEAVALKKQILNKSETTTNLSTLGDFDVDFGDFQSFPILSTSNILGTSHIHSNIPLLPQLSVPTESSKITPHLHQIDDFGEFVSFTSIGSEVAKTDPQPVANILESKSEFLSHLQGSTTSMTKETESPSQHTNNLLFSESERMGLCGIIPQQTQISRPTPLPLRTTLILGPAHDLSETFKELSMGGLSSQKTASRTLLAEEKSPETLSVSSLDLGNYGGSWENTEMVKSTVFNMAESELGGNVKEVSIIEEDVFVVPQMDKYMCFKRESDSAKEECRKTWRRCMSRCLDLVEEGERLFTSVSSSRIIRQLMETEKGRSYILSLREVYLVACRMYHSWIRICEDESVGEIHQKLALAWDSFTPFLMGTYLEDNLTNKQSGIIPQENLTDQRNICRICLIGTEKNLSEEEIMLDYGGSLYHLPCANFWINEIESALPVLQPLLHD